LATAGLLVAALLLASQCNAIAGYEPGRSLTLLNGRPNIGGYLSIGGNFLDDSRDQLGLDDLSTFVTLHLTDNWLVFSEVEVEEGVHLERGGFGTGHDVVSLERLYTEWPPGDSFRRRRMAFWADGTVVVPLNLPSSEPLRRSFREKVLRSDEEELTQWWTRAYFQGVSPPVVLQSGAAVKAYVAITPGAVGYIPAELADSTVTVVEVDLGR
jgi:hypothetical protein